MFFLFFTIFWLCIVIGLICIALRWFSAFENINSNKQISAANAPLVSVILPVRNESVNIARCLSALLMQTYPIHQLEIIIVDDNSTDDTVNLVQGFVSNHPHVQLIQSKSLPSGWTGKTHACWLGAKKARGKWLCFVDADTVAAPELLCSSIIFAQANNIDLLSLQPFQELDSFPERLVIPPGITLMGLYMNIRKINDPTKPDAAANGQFILIRHQVYNTVQGHSAVRSHILEDVALARVIKRMGYRIYVLGGGDLIRTRMYSSLQNIWHGFSKNAIDFIPNFRSALFGGLAILLVSWMPLILAIVSIITTENFSQIGNLPFVLGSLAASITLLGGILLTRSFFQIPFWYTFLFPIGFTTIIAITLNSAWQRIIGRVVWKDREYSFSKGTLI